ncbi:GTPase IMAP family member 8-like [Osmerus eperlanus]|uniref:GTPase IMAP family member 8-like n=1 Tax=Osmerus eperlanus TaxID=29151 RepID=UPI002E124A0A
MSMASGGSVAVAELRIVLLGGRGLGGRQDCSKSSVGNLLLRGDVFETGARNAKNVLRQQEVWGRKLTVVDTPGCMWPCPLSLTPQLDQQELQRNVYLCPPGPHAFLLIIPVECPFDAEHRAALEEHLSSLFSKQVWRHIIIVITAEAPLLSTSLQELIRGQPVIQQLVRKAGGRCHFLDIGNRGDGTQIIGLLEKIDKMVAGNRGGHYMVEKGGFYKLGEKMRCIKKRAEERISEVQSQRSRLRSQIDESKRLSDMRIVLTGSHLAGKSRAANIILGREAFEVGCTRTASSERARGVASGRNLEVVDSPGWFYRNTLEETPKLDKLEIQCSVILCPPGPHAVLLVVPLDTGFPECSRVAVEQHMDLFTEKVWSHTMMLFTHGDKIRGTTVEQHIESEGQPLQWLVEKCGNRYHVLDGLSREDGSQVSELLDKIEEMVAGNGGGYYETDRDVSKVLRQAEREVDRGAEITMRAVNRQRTLLRALFEGEDLKQTELRMLLLGRSNTGKSVAANMILKDAVLDTALPKEFGAERKPTLYVMRQRQMAERNLKVIESPGWDTDSSEQLREHGLSLCSPGPHVFLLVVPLSSSFSERDRRALEEHMKVLGERVWRYTLVLFTWGYWLGDRAIEQHIQGEGEALQWLVEKCGHRYHVLQNTEDIADVTVLIEKIEEMTRRNMGHFAVLSVEDISADMSNRNTDLRRRRSVLNKLVTKVDKLSDREKAWKSKEVEWANKEEEWRRREEECKRREEDLIDRMLKVVLTEPEEPLLPMRRRRGSLEHIPPSMSGGAPSEDGSSYLYCVYGAGGKVSDWLMRRHALACTSGYGSVSGDAFSSEYSYYEEGQSPECDSGVAPSEDGSSYLYCVYGAGGKMSDWLMRRHALACTSGYGSVSGDAFSSEYSYYEEGQSPECDSSSLYDTCISEADHAYPTTPRVTAEQEHWLVFEGEHIYEKVDRDK